MKIKFESQWVEDTEKDDGRGWLFLDTKFPNPFFKPGYGDPLTVFTKTKYFRKRPDAKVFRKTVTDLKLDSLIVLRAALGKVKI